MNDWLDIALISCICTLANHMGFISGVEKVIKRKLIILNCVKCSTFWIVLIYCIFNRFDVIESIAISFFSSYLAIWLELFFGFIDVCYGGIYKKIYKDSEVTAEETNSNYNDTTCSASEMS